MSHTKDIPAFSFKVARSILEMVKYKDVHTFFHCCRVGENARHLAKAAGLTDYEQTVAEYSGLFHDIGKMAVPDHILLKPARLTEDEYNLIKLHPLKSVQIMEPFLDDPFFQDVKAGVESHHERIDGKGYPYGLKDNEIPLMGRLVAIVDAVDAMISTRPYCKGLSIEKVQSELIKYSGSQFDAKLVQIYLATYESYNKSNQESSSKYTAQRILKVAV